MNWQTFDDGKLERAKVHKGWLVRNTEGGAPCFVPDAMHQWQV
jgi:hypothetical protein